MALAGIVALLRNSLNPGLFFAQRNRNFRKLSGYEVTAAIVDISTTLVLIHAGMGAASVLLGSIAGELSKLLMTWTWFRRPIRPTLHWRLIASFTSFGKWIWGSSIIILILNQFDKIIVAKIFGVGDFGIYQVSSRLAQLVVADAFIAVGQYLFPTFSYQYRISYDNAKEFLNKILWIFVPLLMTVSVLMIIFSPWLISFSLGDKWRGAESILRVLSFAMLINGIIALLVPFVRAVGKPKFVTLAAMYQLFGLIIFVPVLIYFYGIIGMAWATTGGLIISMSCLLVYSRKINS